MLVASLTTSNEAWGRNPHVPCGFAAARGRVVVGQEHLGLDRRRRVLPWIDLVREIEAQRPLPGLLVEDTVDPDRRFGARDGEHGRGLRRSDLGRRLGA